jgi:transposase
MDMSPAYQKGAREHLPQARTTFDRFHVVKLLNDAVDQVRRAERKEAPEL